MNALDLMTRLNGEILSNKIRAIIGGEIVVLARMDGAAWVMTERGQTLANEHSNLAAAEQDSNVVKPRRTKEPAAVESASALPEL